MMFDTIRARAFDAGLRAGLPRAQAWAGARRVQVQLHRHRVKHEARLRLWRKLPVTTRPNPPTNTEGLRLVDGVGMWRLFGCGLRDMSPELKRLFRVQDQ